MAYVILPNLQVLFFFDRPVIEYFKKVFMCYFAMSSTVVYDTTIISKALNIMANYMEFRIVKD